MKEQEKRSKALEASSVNRATLCAILAYREAQNKLLKVDLNNRIKELKAQIAAMKESPQLTHKAGCSHE